MKEHNEIKKIAYSLTHDIIWKKNDLVMIDNYRFMHGRRKIDINGKKIKINIAKNVGRINQKKVLCFIEND